MADADVSEQMTFLSEFLQREAKSSRFEWIKVDQVVLTGAIPVIKATGTVKRDNKGDDNSNSDSWKFCRSGEESGGIEIKIDLSFLSPAHTGIQTTSFSRTMCLSNLHTIRPLVLVIKTILSKNGLGDSFVGGVNSYSTLLMVTYFLLSKKVLLR